MRPTFTICIFIGIGLLACADVQKKPENEKPSSNLSSPKNLVERADELCKKLGNCRPAIPLYTQALESDKNSAQLYKKRGMAFYALKEIDTAISDFSKGIELSTEKDPELYFIRGLSKSLLPNDDKQGSCQDLKEAKRLGHHSFQDPEFTKWFQGYC